MQSSLIGKIEKAKRYAEEKDRISFAEFRVNFRGDNDSYTTNFKDGKWYCSCSFFSIHGTCSHSMALERVLSGMLPEEAVSLPLS